MTDIELRHELTKLLTDNIKNDNEFLHRLILVNAIVTEHIYSMNNFIEIKYEKKD